ncbi:MAG: hypothetical protein ACXV74_03640 [Methylobacter sp.]
MNRTVRDFIRHRHGAYVLSQRVVLVCPLYLTVTDLPLMPKTVIVEPF